MDNTHTHTQKIYIYTLALLGKDADKTAPQITMRGDFLPSSSPEVIGVREHGGTVFINGQCDAPICSCPPPHNTLAVFPLAGGLQPAETLVLPQHRRLLDLLLGGEPCLVPQRPGGVGAWAESLHAQRALCPHRNTGNTPPGHHQPSWGSSEWGGSYSAPGVAGGWALWKGFLFNFLSEMQPDFPIGGKLRDWEWKPTCRCPIMLVVTGKTHPIFLFKCILMWYQGINTYRDKRFLTGL